MNDSRQLVLVFGMHRSGTSMLTRLLVDLGFETGSEVLPAADENPEGFWENSAVVGLNERFLQQIGSCWNDPHPLAEEAFTGAIGVKFKKMAEKLVVREFSETAIAVIKDPRMCRVFPLWREAFEKHFDEIKCLHIIRHFHEVCESLRKRNGYSPYFSTLLWIQHLLYAEVFSRPYQRFNLAFDELLEEPTTTIRRLTDFLGAPATAKAGSIGKSIMPSLRHNKVTVTDSFPNHPASTYALELWEQWRNHPAFTSPSDFEPERHMRNFTDLTRMIPLELRGVVANFKQPLASQDSRLQQSSGKMEDPRAPELEKPLAGKEWKQPDKLHNDPQPIKKNFPRNLTKPLRWIKSRFF